MQRVSRDNVKWKQVNIAWTWSVEMTSWSENANENKWFGFSLAVNQNLPEQTRDVIVDEIHGKLREIGLKVKQGGCNLHIFETSKVCEVQGGAYIASRSMRNRLKPDILFFNFFRHILAKKPPYSVYLVSVLAVFRNLLRKHNYFIWTPRWS